MTLDLGCCAIRCLCLRYMYTKIMIHERCEPGGRCSFSSGQYHFLGDDRDSFG